MGRVRSRKIIWFRPFQTQRHQRDLSYGKIKLVLQQIRLLQVALILFSNWIKLRRSHAIHGIYVTCCKICLSRAGKTHQHTQILLKSRTTLHFLQQPSATSLFNSYSQAGNPPIFNELDITVADTYASLEAALLYLGAPTASSARCGE